MAEDGQGGAAMRHFRAIFDAQAVSGLSDGQLLERFNAGRGDGAEIAFEALVRRHGPMVLRACHAALKDEHDAQDAFQAIFLILARRARTLWVGDSLGPWLHAVSVRVAMCARSASQRRRAHERKAAEVATAKAAVGDELDDLGPLLHEEVGRLPERYRIAVVLCDLQGLTHQEASQRLRWPIGTVKSRQARGRERLRARLLRRGLAPATGAIATLLAAEGASAAVPPSLVEVTTRLAAEVSKGPVVAGMVPAAVDFLANRAEHAMWMLKCKAATAVVLTLGIALVSVRAIAQLPNPPRPEHKGAGVRPEATLKAKPAPADPAAPIPVDPADVVEAPKPADPETLARKLDEARIDLELLENEINLAKATINEVQQAALRQEIGAAGESGGKTDEEREEADQRRNTQRKILKSLSMDARSKLISKMMEKAYAERRLAEAEKKAGLGGRGSTSGRGGQGSSGIEARMSEMERKIDRLLAATEGPGRDPAKPPKLADRGDKGEAVGGGPAPEHVGGGGAEVAKPPRPRPPITPEEKARNEAVRKKLDQPMDLLFPSETPLEDVLKYIEQVQQATAGPNGGGFPIYVDPDGLADADAKMGSTVKINLQGVPLKTGLRLMLRQLHLGYGIDDGILIITNLDSDDLDESQ